MNKTEQETPFSEENIKFSPHIVYTFFGPFNRRRRQLKGWHLYPLHAVECTVSSDTLFLILVLSTLNTKNALSTTEFEISREEDKKINKSVALQPEEPRLTVLVAARWQYRRPCG